MRRPAALAALFIVLACGIYLVSLIAHDRFHQDDFRTYYRASGDLVAGKPLYFVTSADAPYLYRYPPTVALAFLPFRALPIRTAALIWYVVNTALVVVLWILLGRAFGPLRPHWAIVFFIAIGVTLERELGVGNINLLNLVLCVGALELIRSGRAAAAGLMLAWTIMAKPPNALILVPTIGAAWNERSRGRALRLVFAFLAGAVVMLAIPIPFYGFSGTVHLYGEFVRSMAEFRTSFGDSFKYDATTAGLLERAVAVTGVRVHQHPASAVVGLALALACIVVAARRRDGETLAPLIAMALVPVTAMADSQIMMFAAPLVYLLLRRWQTESWSAWRKIALIGALVLYGGNWHDLWGGAISRRMMDWGIHGLGDWCLVVFALCS